MPRRDPRRARALLAAWLVASFALSAVTDWRVLAGAGALALALLARGALAHLRRVARVVLPLSLGASLVALGLDRVAGRPGPGWDALLALNLRAALLAFLALAVLARVDVLAAAERWPWATRVLVVVLAQIHALRLLATDSLLGLRSRLLRRPGPVDVVRGAGGITGALLTISMKNARDVSDAMRSRGF
jgi:cobalt/nickel transport system permease protein